jgi:threonine dehydrogenase-like Zn-dependent dehydrogenase
MAIVELGRVRAGQTVVVQGTGGVAVFAIQLALAHGARVIVTTSSEAKIDRLRRLGPVEAINRAVTPEWQHEVRRLTGPRAARGKTRMRSSRGFARLFAFGGEPEDRYVHGLVNRNGDAVAMLSGSVRKPHRLNVPGDFWVERELLHALR